MMGTSIDGNAAASNSAQAGSSPASPANCNDKYHAAGITAMDAYCKASIDAGRISTQQGCLDAAVEGMAAVMIRDTVQQVVSELFDRYIDSETGA